MAPAAKNTKTAKKKTSKRASPKKKPSKRKRARAGTGAASTTTPASELLNRAERLGAILSRGLDLAEASLSLGLTLVNRVGNVAQESILERVPGVGNHGDGMEHGPADGEHHPVAPPPPVEGGTSSEHGYFIVNRLPLHPGDKVAVSFSINNDSLSTQKKVEMRVNGFAGETSGAQFGDDGFVVRPARKSIAPMDFEKFVLRGTIPEDAATDVYRGVVVVSSEDLFDIPVRLVVTPPAG